MSTATRARALPGILIFTVMVTAIISSLGAPLIPSISDDLGVPLSAAQWSLTATLLAWVLPGATAGRDGDLDPTELRREEEDAELASAGLPGVPTD